MIFFLKMNRISKMNKRRCDDSHSDVTVMFNFTIARFQLYLLLLYTVYNNLCIIKYAPAQIIFRIQIIYRFSLFRPPTKLENAVHCNLDTQCSRRTKGVF